MAHISSIGAAMFTDLSISTPVVGTAAANLANSTTAVELQSLFSTEIAATGTRAGTVDATGLGTSTTFVRVANVRSFPAIGTPANIVKVPTYGAKTSMSIQGQADAPQLEFDINFIPGAWTKPATGVYVAGTDSILGNAVGSNEQFVFRMTLLGADSAGVTPATKYASTALGLGTVENSQYYWLGKMESLLITPSLSDATTAKLTVSIQSAFYGAFTI
jgi:hypothetical protein